MSHPGRNGAMIGINEENGADGVESHFDGGNAYDTLKYGSGGVRNLKSRSGLW